MASETGWSKSACQEWVAYCCVHRKMGRSPAVPRRRRQPDRPVGTGIPAPQHRQHVENSRRRGAPGQRHPQRLRHRAELQPGLLGEAAHRRLGGLRRPRRRPSSSAVRNWPISAGLSGVSTAAAFGSIGSGRSAKMKPALSSSSISVLARSFSPGIACSNWRAGGVVELGGDRGAVRQVLQQILQHGHESLIVGLADVMAVEVFQLGEIEPRRRAADRRQVEGVDHLLRREDLLVAVAPAEPHQIVAQRRRQIAHRPIGIDAERAVALRQLRAVRAVDQRDMRHRRQLPAERVVDLLLPRGVDQMIVAADDVGDAHVVVVDHHRQHVGRRCRRRAAAPDRRGSRSARPRGPGPDPRSRSRRSAAPSAGSSA